MSTDAHDSTHFGDPDGTDGDTTLDLGHLMAPQGLPVTDEEGNPIHFTMQDGSQLQVPSYSDRVELPVKGHRLL